MSGDHNMYANWEPKNGMDLRDYFAAKAMQGLIQASATLKADDVATEDLSFLSAAICGVNSEIKLTGDDKDGTEFRFTWARYYAEEAYAIADAMMKAREQ